MTNNTETMILIIFVAFTGLAVLMQASVLLAMFIVMRKSLKLVQENVEELRAKVLPVLNEAGDFMHRVGPKLELVANDVSELVHDLRVQGNELQTSANEIMEKMRRQTSRMDAMLTGVLNTFDRATGLLNEVIGAPLRQLNAVAASARAIFNSLVSKAPAPAPTHAAADKDLFV